MSRQPLVSVVTPAYNHARFLDDYLNGLVHQTYPRIELIVVDDCSTDDSWERVQEQRVSLECRFEGVQLKRNKSNLGLMSTLGVALAGVHGELICILESDDYFYPTKIERNVGRLSEDRRLGLVHSEVDFLYEPEGRLEKAHWRQLGRKNPQGRIFEDLLVENHILTCTACMRTDALLQTIDLDRYEAAGYKTADYPLFLDLAKRFHVGYIDEPLACYRVVQGSISHPKNEIRQLEWKLNYYRVKMDYIDRYGAPERVRQRATRQYHRTLYRHGWLRGDADSVERGLEGLREAGAIGETQRLVHRARRHLVHSRPTWRLARQVESMWQFLQP